MTFLLLAFADACITDSSLTVATIGETSIAIASECGFPFGVQIPFWSAAAYCRRFGMCVLGNRYGRKDLCCCTRWTGDRFCKEFPRRCGWRLRQFFSHIDTTVGRGTCPHQLLETQLVVKGESRLIEHTESEMHTGRSHD